LKIKKNIMEAYIVAGKRSAVGKANKGGLRFTRPDDMAAAVIKDLLKELPNLDPKQVNDIIVGNAMPEAEQGLNFGRLISLMAMDNVDVPGMTVNRYCASGLETIAIATAKIRMGMADCIIAGGSESMSFIPMGGWKVTPNYSLAKDHADYYNNMGLTAEAVAEKYKVSREDQDAFALRSHQRALDAIQRGAFKSQITPISVEEVYLDENEKRQTRSFVVDTDEGPRAGTNLDALGKLRPVFADKGSVTAGNASQTSDGASFVVVMSEKLMKELNLEPIARLVNYDVAGVEPRVMGIGPVFAIPKVLKRAGMRKEDIEQIELNEAFASQSLAVMRELDLNPDIVNVNGGAIALGHPLGCSGAKLSVQLFNEMKARNQRYGMVTMCVGTGQGAAGIYEVF
jgi:acetyl-CoA acyltransferase